MKTVVLTSTRTVVCPAPVGPGVSGDAVRILLDPGSTYQLRATGALLLGGSEPTLTDGIVVTPDSPLDFEATASEVFARAIGTGDVVASVSPVRGDHAARPVAVKARCGCAA